MIKKNNRAYYECRRDCWIRMKKLSGSDVLVVDDNSANTLVLKAMVERYGVHADTA